MEWELLEKTIRLSDEDGIELKKRYTSSQNKKKIILPNGQSITEPTKRNSGYDESETLILLNFVQAYYPNFFPFQILDYNTNRGIDFVAEVISNPKYIELKGTLHKSVNHAFRNIFKFICYDIDLNENDEVTDIEMEISKVKINKNDSFESFDANYKGKNYKSYKLDPIAAKLQSMEIMVLKEILTDVLGAKIN